MPELAAKPALAGLASIGEGAGVRVRLRGDFRLVSVLARPGQANALADAVQAAFAMALIDGPKHTAVGDIAALGIGPHRWLFLREGGDRDFPGALATVLTGLASLSDQSGSYAVFEIGGPNARQALAKGVPVDLHEAVFSASDVAITTIAHMNAIVWRKTPGHFAVAVFRSYADSFWHWLSASAAEFGLDFATAGDVGIFDGA